MANKKADHPSLSKYPRRVTLELTNNCNYNCTFCPRRLMTQETGYISVDLAKRVIDEISEHLPVTFVPFFRGESLLHPHWMEILSYAKKKGVGPIQLTTNGSLLDRKASHFLIENEIDFVSFSLDTIDGKIYQESRRGSSYEKVLNNILTFLDLKEQSMSALPEVQVSAVETEAYRPGLDDFIDFWQTKVDRVRIYLEHSSGDQPGSIDENIPDFDLRLPCFKPFEDIIILWNGEVALCNHDWTRENSNPIANVNNMSVDDAWNSDRYRSIREMHVNGQTDLEEICKHCDHWKINYMPQKHLGRLIIRLK